MNAWHRCGALRIAAGALALLGAACLAGCAGGPGGAPGATSAPQAQRQAKQAGVVYGRVVQLVDGKEKDWGSGIFADGVVLAVRSLDRDDVRGYRVKGDGSFVWTLPPGRYVIAAFRRPRVTGRLWLSFTVPEPGRAAYIGDLGLSVDKSMYSFGVRDDYAATSARLEARLQAAHASASKDMMQPPPRVGSYDAVWGICSTRGGLSCGSGRIGVQPLMKGATSGHPAVDSLTPLLRWTPTARSGITYDVAVYRTVSVRSMDFGLGSIRGPLVAYAQDLREPSYRIPSPLEPGEDYEWSVRLRDGNTVSSWSTSGYFAFFVVGYVSEHGRWFGFSTPAAR